MAEKGFVEKIEERGKSTWSQHKFTYLLSSLVLLFLIFPFLESNEIGTHLFVVVTTLILLGGILTVSHSKRNLMIALAIGIPAIFLNVGEDLFSNDALYYMSHFFLFASFAFTVIVLFSHLLKERRVTHDAVLGAISIYVLIAMSFTSLYLLADWIRPGSFIITLGPHANQQLTYSDYMYYSLGTITTSGSGNIVEIGSFVRSLSMIEAIIGLFYIAFIISKLVASFDGIGH